MRAPTIGSKMSPSPTISTPKQIWHTMFEIHPNMPRNYENHDLITSSTWYRSEDLENFFDDDSLTSNKFTNTMHDLAHAIDYPHLSYCLTEIITIGKSNINLQFKISSNFIPRDPFKRIAFLLLISNNLFLISIFFSK